MALVKLKGRVEEKFGPNSWAGIQIFRCPNNSAKSWADMLWGTPMAGHTGATVPKAARVRYKRDAEPDQAHITAYYKTERVPGKAVLKGRIYNRVKRTAISRDINGDIIEGPDPDGVHNYVVVEGTNVQVEPIEAMVLQTASTGLNLPAIRARHNCINNATLSNFGNAPPGSLWFWAFPYEKQLETAGAVWNIDYVFLVSPYRTPQGNVLSWNAGLKSQQATWMIQRAPVFEIQKQGTPIEHWQALATYREKIRLQPGIVYYKNADDVWMIGRRDPVSRKPFREVDFSAFNAMLQW